MPRKRKSKSPTARIKRYCIYCWVLRKPARYPGLGKYDYYGGNMPRPAAFSRQHAKFFRTRDEAEMFIVKKIRQYPMAMHIRGFQATRIKLAIEEHPNHWCVDYWHKVNMRD